MANGLRALVCLDNYYAYPQKAYVELGKEPFRKNLYEQVRSSLTDYLKSEISYIVEYTSERSSSFCIGIEDADIIRQEALSWNDSIIREARRSFEVFERAKDDQGYSSIGDLIVSMESNGTPVKSQNFNYGTALYDLRQSLSELEDIFSYGAERIVLPNMEQYSSFTIKIQEEVKQDVLSHPEGYAVIEIYYK